VPTSMTGTFGQKWDTSGNHLSATLPRLSGLATLKQISITFVSGYDSGLQTCKITDNTNVFAFSSTQLSEYLSTV